MSKLIANATIVNEGKQSKGHILIKDGKIIDLYTNTSDINQITYDEYIEAKGKIVLPGIIDDQVHFREPGLTSKGDIYTESKAAVAGGITSYMEMPNTQPQTVSQELLEDKHRIAEKSSLANFSFYLGATNDNIEELLKTDPKKVCGIKVFMGSSTGNMLVNNYLSLEAIFSQSPVLVAVHCEDEYIVKANLEKYKLEFGEDIPIHYHPYIRTEEACYKSSHLAVELAKKYNTRLHLLHISTAKELSLFDYISKLKDKRITSEVCVHHLWFDDRDYERLGSRIKWNPAIKKESDREALFNGLFSNHLDIIATDHAPHTIDEKNNSYLKAPSGGPLVQHSLLVMLEFFHQGKISLEQIANKMCHAPAEVFQLEQRGYIRKGYWADLVLIDLNNNYRVTKDNIYYKCGWSPFENYTFGSKIYQTYVNGNLVYDNGTFYETNKGMALTFNR